MAVKFTNKHNLPESFVNAVLVDEHVSLGNISVTQLIDAPQVRMLKKTNDYTMDVMDMMAMVIGTGIHTVLERGDMKGTHQSRKLQSAIGVLSSLDQTELADKLKNVIAEELKETIDDDVVVEKTLTIEIAGWTVSGTFDRFTKSLKLLEDYKTGAASQLMFPETKKSWNAQQNMYATMMRANGYDVEKARIIAVLKDWSKMKIKTNRDYPRTPVVMHEIPLIPNEQVIEYMEKRVKLHQRAEAGENILCTPKDRWAKPDEWVVKLVGGKRALKKFTKPALAEAYIEGEGFRHSGDLEVQHRPSSSFRCANGYCPVADVCPQYAKEKELATQRAEEM